MINRILLIIFISFILSGCAGVSSKGIFGTGVSVAFDPRTVGTQIDDSIMQKNLTGKMVIKDKKYLLSVKSKVLDGRIFLTGKVDNPEEKDLVISEASEILDVENVIASIILVEDLRIQRD